MFLLKQLHNPLIFSMLQTELFSIAHNRSNKREIIQQEFSVYFI